MNNQSGGYISGDAFGVGIVGAAGAVTNAGSITGTSAGSAGVYLGDGGTVTNAGAITAAGSGGGAGVLLFGGGAVTNTVTNQAGGTISGDFGVIINGAVGAVSNAGSIEGLGDFREGVRLDDGGTVTNSGAITDNGYYGAGVVLLGGGTVTNQSGGTITANGDYGVGVYLSDSGTVTNAGAITAGGYEGKGVYLYNGGTVINQSGGSINGETGVYVLGATGTVTNAGTITGIDIDEDGDNDAAGVYLGDGGTVTNQSGGTISGEFGVTILGGGTVTNAGTITSKGTDAVGVYIDGGGTVTNQSGGTISGYTGVVIADGAGTVINAGSIISTGADGSGVYLNNGTVTNQSGGTISGDDGVYIGGDGTVVNAGTITGANVDDDGDQDAAGVYIGGDGTVTNQSGGSISGETGVYIYGVGTVTNAGTISGSLASVEFAGAGANTLTLQTGSTLVGDAIGSTAGGATNALVLQGTGTANNNFLHFNTLNVQASGDWTLGGTSTIGATTVSTGKLIVTGPLTSAFTINSGGTLQGSTSTLLAQGGVTDEGTLVFDQASDGTFANAINGSGGLVKQNAGVLTLTGTSSVGSTTVSGGTLIVAGPLTSAFTTNSGGTLQGSTSTLLAQGGVTDNGTLVFDQASDGTFANAINGSGGLVKQNAGVLTLSGTSSVGSTTVSGGSLIVTGPLTSAFTIDSGGTLQGSTSTLLAQGGVTDNGTLVFDQASDGTFANAITGSGSLVKQNAGALTLSGTSSVGSTTVSGGSLIVTGPLTSAFTIDSGGTLQGSTSTLLAQGDVTDNGTLVFDQASDGTFANAINGSGSLIKQNAGVLALNGVSVLGATTVAGGNLRIGDAGHPSAQLTSTVTVQAGATLSGHGTVVGSVTNNGGTISPGGSIGTLTVNGDLTQSSNSVLSAEIAPLANSKLVVTGTANLGGSVVLVSAPGNYRKGTTYTYLTAGTINGAFSTVTATGGLQVGGPNLLTGTAVLLSGSFTNVGGTPQPGGGRRGPGQRARGRHRLRHRRRCMDRPSQGLATECGVGCARRRDLRGLPHGGPRQHALPSGRDQRSVLGRRRGLKRRRGRPLGPGLWPLRQG